MAPNRASARTRARVVQTVRELLADGSFHTSTVEEVAERAGVSRATVYQHFGSRLGLVDAMCEAFDATPALRAIRETTDLSTFVALTVEFWSSEERILAALYGAAAVDPAARDFVKRQRRDRKRELRRVAGADDPLLLVLTSFETYVELRRQAGLSPAQITTLLQRAVRPA